MLRKFKLTLLVAMSIVHLSCDRLLSFLSDPFYVYEYQLENGLKVFLSVNKHQPVVKSSILVSVGSANDPEDATGLAHYLEHLMFKGTSQLGTIDYQKEKPYLDKIESLFETYRKTSDPKERSKLYAEIDTLSLEASQFVVPNEFSRMQAMLGIVDANAFTSQDRTFYVATVPANQIENFLRLEYERFKDPVFRTFHTELESVFEERNLRVADAKSQLFRQYDQAMFPKHPYGEKSPIGTDEHLKNPSIQRIHSFFKEHYIPSKMAICMSGDINPEEVYSQIKQTFGELPSKESKEDTQPEWKPLEKDLKISIPSPQKHFLFGIRIPKKNPKIVASTEGVSLLLSNGYNGLLEESLYYTQKANHITTFINEWKDYLVLTIWIDPNPGLSLAEAKKQLVDAIKKIESSELPNEMYEGLNYNRQIYLTQKKDDNDFRIREMSEAFLAGWSRSDLDQKFSAIKQSNANDLAEFTKEYIEQNIVSIETFSQNPKFDFIEKPPISKLQFSKVEESNFKKQFSFEPSYQIEPEFADFDRNIKFKQYPNGNQFIYQKNAENSLYRFKILIPEGAWISPHIDLSINYWKQLGTDLYTVGALSTKFYLWGTEIKMQRLGDDIEITLQGEDEHFIPSFQLLEHSIKSVTSSKDVFDSIVDYQQRSDKMILQDENEINSALNEFALHGDKSYRFFQSNRSDLLSFKSSQAIDHLKSLLKQKLIITYYGNVDFDTLEKKVFSEYFQSKGTFDTHSLSQKAWREEPKSKFYILSRSRPHIELNFFAPFRLKEEHLASSFFLYNTLHAGLSSPFFLTMREQTGNAYSAFSYIIDPEKKKDPALWYVNLACQADKLSNCLEDANASLRKLEISEKRFSEAKQSALLVASLTKKSNVYLIDEFIRAQYAEVTEDVDKLRFDSLSKIEWKDFIDFTKKLNDATFFQIALIGDAKRLDRPTLQRYGELETVSERKILGK
ncbi:peptidase M16 inactive domain protein [Leptospira ryugenii]|uniref:Peptidase M16 inactive domain protein n=1 Tax=Leptospira ryugenii TaxID=1917863 RepID=A0A2P2DZQ4_9LEPT|nr:insulinase family protein [Leptospira ryugenii]GBF50103.1 peptidase M16 inactive domain protein [Leptospira ryugenii]